MNIAVYDNQGKTVDRYTVVDLWTKRTDQNKTLYMALSVSDDPKSYMGVSQWSEAILGKHLGKKVQFDRLPKDVQEHVKMRFYPEDEKEYINVDCGNCLSKNLTTFIGEIECPICQKVGYLEKQV